MFLSKKKIANEQHMEVWMYLRFYGNQNKNPGNPQATSAINAVGELKISISLSIPLSPSISFILSHLNINSGRKWPNSSRPKSGHRINKENVNWGNVRKKKEIQTGNSKKFSKI